MRLHRWGPCLLLLACGLCAEENASTSPKSDAAPGKEPPAKVETAPQAKPPEPAQIDQWIKDLSSEEYETRTDAEKRLRAAGAAAFEALKAEQRKTDDAQALSRLKVLVRQIGAQMECDRLVNQEGIEKLPSGLRFKMLK